MEPSERTWPPGDLSGAALVATIGFHYVSPWAARAVWLLFDPRRRLSWRTVCTAFVCTAFVWPVLWLVLAVGLGLAAGFSLPSSTPSDTLPR